MGKIRLIFISLISLLILLTLGFIWGNSILSISQSSNRSGSLFLTFKPIFDVIFGEGVVTHAVFRKLAHFSEFFVLGVEIFTLLILLRISLTENLTYSLVFGLFFAVSDETLQVISRRGSSFLDVLIDFSGVLLAVLILFLVFKTFYKKNKKTIEMNI